MASAEQGDPKQAPLVDPSDWSPGAGRRVRGVVISLLFVHSGLLAHSAYVHSPTMNEPGHLVAGISHWRFGRFELYRVNPPLVRMVAALPVLAVGADTDCSNFYESPGARPVFPIGEKFVTANGERSFWLFTIARWACIPFSLLGGYMCYRWASELYGDMAGLLALSVVVLLAKYPGARFANYRRCRGHGAGHHRSLLLLAMVEAADVVSRVCGWRGLGSGRVDQDDVGDIVRSVAAVVARLATIRARPVACARRVAEGWVADGGRARGGSQRPQLGLWV